MKIIYTLLALLAITLTIFTGMRYLFEKEQPSVEPIKLDIPYNFPNYDNQGKG